MPFNYHQDFIGGEIYHLYNRCVTGFNAFQNSKDCALFLNKFNKYFGPYVTVYAYCLMPNHFHLIVRVHDIDEIETQSLDQNESKAIKLFCQNHLNLHLLLVDQLKRFNSSVTLSLKNKYDRRGPVFIRKTKRVIIYGSIEVLSKICYIHHNPIHHGFVGKYQDWPQSSYSLYFDHTNPILGPSEILKFIGNGNIEIGKREFLQIHQDYKYSTKDDLN